MDADARKTALRMIPYGVYVLTAVAENGSVAAATVNWVTQASFKPPLLALGVKADSGAHALIKESRVFALNVLEKGQQEVATAFFKHTEREGDRIGGQSFEMSPHGAPLLLEAAAWVECKLVDTMEGGDHSVFVGEVTDAGVRKAPEGRPDEAVLACKDLGTKVFYGG